MSRFNSAFIQSPRFKGAGGFSLFEVLIVLSILATILAVSVASFRPPSDEVQLNQVVSNFVAEVTEARLRAIKTNKVSEIEAIDCNKDPMKLNFFPDGTATAAELCFFVGDIREALFLTPLTGQVSKIFRDE